ncbi:MAG: hypothetical protein JOY91_13085 [Sinobacteraceae bacterium]|nr:hypothetical protein [Nevskiaceae bacterium]
MQRARGDPFNLVDLRAGPEGQQWSVTAWSKNLTNKYYNAESSSGGFLWRALPLLRRRFHVQILMPRRAPWPRHIRFHKIAHTRRADAHQELNRWLAGNHQSNNTYR